MRGTSRCWTCRNVSDETSVWSDRWRRTTSPNKSGAKRVRLRLARTNSSGSQTRRRIAVRRGTDWITKGKSSETRRDDNQVVQHRYHCPAEHCRSCPLRQRCVRNPDKGRTVKRLEGEELIEAHKEWMKTEEAKAANRLRGSVIERCFGDAKTPSQSPLLAWSWTEAGQGSDRTGGLGPNRIRSGKAPQECRNPSGKRHLKAGRSLRRGGWGGGRGTARHEAVACSSFFHFRGSAPLTPPMPALRKGRKGIGGSRAQA